MTYTEKYIIARWAYSIGKEFISDDEYGQLENYIKEYSMAPEYTNRTWSEDKCPVELLKKYGYDSWIETVEQTGRIYTASMESITEDYVLPFSIIDGVRYQLSYKYDGWSIQIYYSDGWVTKLETRGRDSEAMLVNGAPPDVPQIISDTRDLVVVGELYLTEENFKRLTSESNIERESIRASVRTAIARKRFDLLNFVAYGMYIGNKQETANETYKILKSLGFKTSEFEQYIDNTKALEYWVYNPPKNKKELNYPTDGIVLRDNNTNYCKAIRLGSWATEILKSYITGYVENYSNIYISQAVSIYTIKSEHSKHSTVSVTNLAHIVNLNLEIGAPIAFKLVSGVIGILDEENTKILHETYKGRFDKFREEVRLNESYKYSVNLIADSNTTE